MSLQRLLSSLVVSLLFVFGCVRSQQAQRPTTSWDDAIPSTTIHRSTDPVTELMSSYTPRCLVEPPNPVEGSSVVEVRMQQMHRVIYRMAVVNGDQRRQYPPPAACYLEGIEGQETSVYFQVNDPRAVAITAIEPSNQPGQGRVNPGGVILPRHVTLAGRPVATRVECWHFADMTACEHAIQTTN